MITVDLGKEFCERCDLQGDDHGPKLHQQLRDAPPGEDVAFCLNSVKYLGYSYSKPTIRKAVQNCMEGAYGNRRLYIISKPNEQLLEGLSAALKEERLTMYAAPDEEDIGTRGYLLGAITDALRETFDVILRWGPITTGDLAKSLNTSPQNAKNRVDRLMEKRLATREKVAGDTGGQVWLNRIR